MQRAYREARLHRLERWRGVRLFPGPHEAVPGSAINHRIELLARVRDSRISDRSIRFDTTACYRFEPAPAGTLFARLERGCARVDANSISQN